MSRTFLGTSMAATMVWTVAWGLMIAGLIVDGESLRDWGLFLGMIAATTTVWLILQSSLRRERVRLERLAEVMADVVREQRDVSHIGR